MKKLLFLSLVIISLSSCKKEDVSPQQQCNCGLITSDNVSDYSVVIRNSCSGNEQKFYLQPGDWMNAHVGTDYCITNVQSW
jgi:hypothetical protein